MQFIEQRTGQLLDKVDTLEEVQAGMLTELSNRTRQLLLTSPPVDPAHALRDVRSIVGQRLELPALQSSIISARPTQPGIVITVRNVADKLRILYRAQRRLDVAQVVMQDYTGDDDGSPDDGTSVLDNSDELFGPDSGYDGKITAPTGDKNPSEWSEVNFDVRIGTDDDDAKAGHRTDGDRMPDIEIKIE